MGKPRDDESRITTAITAKYAMNSLRDLNANQRQISQVNRVIHCARAADSVTYFDNLVTEN